MPNTTTTQTSSTPGTQLAWKRRALVCTGPATYYVSVPIVGSVPGPTTVHELVAGLQRACQSAPARDGLRVRAVRGRVVLADPSGPRLSIYVTVANGSADRHRDAAYVADVLRAAARNTPAATTGIEMGGEHPAAPTLAQRRRR